MMPQGNRFAVVIVACVLAAGAVPATASPELTNGPGRVDGKVVDAGLDSGVPLDGFIVKYRADTPAAGGDLGSAQSALPTARGEGSVRLAAEVPMASQRFLVRGYPAVSDAGQARRVMREIARDDRVESVEPNLVLFEPAQNEPNDEFYRYQWHYHQGEAAGIRLPGAWNLGANGWGVTVAVVDSGITAHPDLDDRRVPGYDFISSAFTSRDGAGRDSDPSDEGDWNAENECLPQSRARASSWHGTHVAGTVAAATGNRIGLAGVAPAARFQPIRVLGRCGGTVADIADAIQWASGAPVPWVPANATPAQVINLSLGGKRPTPCPPAYREALAVAARHGAVLVAAAGNENEDASNYTLTNCGVDQIVVAALGREGNRAAYSNFGSAIDVAAPGGDQTADVARGVLSTFNLGSTTPGASGFAYQQGTSMAAPHVAGIAALVLSAPRDPVCLDPNCWWTRPRPPLISTDVKQIITGAVRPIPGRCAEGCGAGLVDATASVRIARIWNSPI